MGRIVFLLLVIALALPAVPLVHPDATHSGHASAEAHDAVTIALCHTTVGDPQASGEHVHQCGISAAILPDVELGATIRDHGLQRPSRIGPYTSPAFDPPERPPNRLT
jgi:hypothetical protein